MKKPKYKTMYMTQRQLDMLPVYNISTPSGVYIGKIWKKDLNKVAGEDRYWKFPGPPKWLVCTFEEEPDQVTYPNTVKNGYYIPVITEKSSIVVGGNSGGAKVFKRHNEEYKGDYDPVRWE